MIRDFRRVARRFYISWIAYPVLLVLAPAQLAFAAFASWFIGNFVGAMENIGFDDPVYRRNIQKLIEHNRQFEEARE
jgi:hypothetical protein